LKGGVVLKFHFEIPFLHLFFSMINIPRHSISFGKQVTQLSSLMTNLRRLINEALAAERFEDASELQCKRPHWPHLQQPAKTPG